MGISRFRGRWGELRILVDGRGEQADEDTRRSEEQPVGEEKAESGTGGNGSKQGRGRRRSGEHVLGIAACPERQTGSQYRGHCLSLYSNIELSGALLLLYGFSSALWECTARFSYHQQHIKLCTVGSAGVHLTTHGALGFVTSICIAFELMLPAFRNPVLYLNTTYYPTLSTVTTERVRKQS